MSIVMKILPTKILGNFFDLSKVHQRVTNCNLRVLVLASNVIHKFSASELYFKRVKHLIGYIDVGDGRSHFLHLKHVGDEMCW